VQGASGEAPILGTLTKAQETNVCVHGDPVSGDLGRLGTRFGGPGALVKGGSHNLVRVGVQETGHLYASEIC
jgi:hypothetical protein